MAQGVVTRFDGEVPSRLEDLVTLPGVGRKTANVVRSVAFGLPGLPVDTHVQRLARRLGLTEATDPVQVELALNPMIPAGERGAFSLRLILHGRATCRARNPRCVSCVLSDFCPTGRIALATEQEPSRKRRDPPGDSVGRGGRNAVNGSAPRRCDDWKWVGKHGDLDHSEPVPANWFR